MTARDLFGEPVREGTMPGLRRAKRDKKTGHAAPIGSGPAGETCKTCRHYKRVKWAGIYRKCGLMRSRWTHGPGSDIRANDAACRHWEKPAPPQDTPPQERAAR